MPPIAPSEARYASSPTTGPFRLRAALACSAGAVAIEAAFILPILLAFGLGIIEVGRALWIQNSLQFAVEDAARCAAINTTACATNTQIQSYAASRAIALNIPTSAFTVSSPTCGKLVSASYAFQSVVPNLVPISVTLTAKSCHPA